MRPPFRFRRFVVAQDAVVHPVGTDGVLLGAWADVAGAQRILDIGGGSGVVALMLAQRTETTGALITAVEMHAATYAQMQENFAASPWMHRLDAYCGPIQAFSANAPPVFDLIVSNPPFFTELTVSPDPERRLGRDTGTLSPNDLLQAIHQMLHPQGRVALILPVLEGKRLCEMAAVRGLYCTAEVQVHARPHKPAERLLLELQRTPFPFRRSTLALHPATSETRTPEFATLTAAFYL